MTILRVLTATVVVALLSGGAFARPIPKGGVTIDDVTSVMFARGLPVEVQPDTRGAPAGTQKIRTTHQGIIYYVYFYECQERCISIGFSASWDITNGSITLAEVNTWNERKRYGRAYVESDGDVYIEMDVDTERGFTTEAIDNNFDRWFVSLTNFKKFVDAGGVVFHD